MLGALVIGMATEVSAAFIVSDYKYAVAFVILIGCSRCARPACSARGPEGSQAVVYYITTLLVYAGSTRSPASASASSSASAGVTNFGFIIFQAAGAYTGRVLVAAGGWRKRRVPAVRARLESALPAPADRRDARRRPAVGAVCADRRPAPAWRLRRRRPCSVTAVMFNLLVTNFQPF